MNIGEQAKQIAQQESAIHQCDPAMDGFEQGHFVQDAINKMKPKIKAVIVIHQSTPDRDNNSYAFFTYTDTATGTRWSGETGLGHFEGNARAMMLANGFDHGDFMVVVREGIPKKQLREMMKSAQAEFCQTGQENWLREKLKTRRFQSDDTNPDHLEGQG